MDDVETRELRYFVAVAEELHFGRAAERLGISQPPLSRAIRRLERRLGVVLLERTSRTARLTAAGEVLLHDGRAALAAMTAATRRAQRAGQAEPRLVLVLKPGGDAALLRAILDEYATEPDAVRVELAFSAGERAAMLRDGRADVALLHRPQNDLTGLDFEDLRTERQVAVLAAGHPLARRRGLCLDDLRGVPMPRWPEGRHADNAGPGGPVRDGGELLQLVALDRMVALLPESIRDRLPSGVVCRPVADAPTATMVLAWPPDSRSRQVADFVRAAVRVAA
jgi:DNA-binding transcriptional LysR family regulator